MNQDTTPTTILEPNPLAEAEGNFTKNEKCIAILRAFLAEHRDAFAQFCWRAYGWNDTDIEFNIPGYPAQQAKDIARAFGPDGWKRSYNPHACGSINWTKELEGVKLIIRNAEQAPRKLVEEVKL